MNKFAYLAGIYLVSLVIVLTVYFSSNPFAKEDKENVAGVGSTRELLTKAQNLSQHDDFEIFCDGKGNYVVTHQGARFANLEYTFVNKSKVINGRTYYYDLSFKEVQALIGEYQDNNPKTNIDFSTVLTGCMAHF
jgi:hypothetical protein